ncbi:MAG: hypothetical protein GY821_00880 [Gammaproteobacteria bacterium]|nr:hypothetical protein [Gammaproteobacteria bacterium]
MTNPLLLLGQAQLVEPSKKPAQLVVAKHVELKRVLVLGHESALWAEDDAFLLVDGAQRFGYGVVVVHLFIKMEASSALGVAPFLHSLWRKKRCTLESW